MDLDDNYNVIVGTRNGNHKGTIYYLDENGKIIWQKNIPRIIGSVDISDDGRYITTNGYELTDGRAQTHQNSIIEVFDNRMTKLWDFPRNPNVSGIDYTSYTVAVDDTNLSILHESDLGFYDIHENKLWNYTLSGNSGIIDISDNEKTIAVASHNDFDNTDYDWSLDIFTTDGAHLWHKSGIGYQTIDDNAVAVSPSGSHIAIGLAATGDEGLIQVFDKSGDLLWSDTTDSVVSDVYFSPDGKNLVSGTNNGLRFYDMQGNLLWTRQETFYSRFSADYIIGTSPVEYHYVLKIMDYSGKIISEFEIASAIRDVAITSDSGMIVVGTKGISDIGSGTLYYFKK